MLTTSAMQVVDVQHASVMQVQQLLANVVSKKSPANDGSQSGSLQKGSTNSHELLVRFC